MKETAKYILPTGSLIFGEYMKRCTGLFLLIWINILNAQYWTPAPLDSLKGVSIRALSVVNKNVFWAGASQGKVYRCINGQKGEWIQVPGYEKAEFRGIKAFSSQEAIVMSITEPAVLLRTMNAGLSWTPVFTDTTRGAFFDALLIEGNKGYLLGDPLKGRFFLAETLDGGQSWKAIKGPPAREGEAAFASSNSSLAMDGRKKGWIGSGGLYTHLLSPEEIVLQVPLMQGKNSTGVNALALRRRQLLLAGGDFSNPYRKDSSLAYFKRKRKKRLVNPDFRLLPSAGYSSAVQWINQDLFITTGTGHTSLHSFSRGILHTMPLGFHTIMKWNRNLYLLAGSGGRIYRLQINP